MSVATALARARVRSTSTTSRATPRIAAAKAHAEPTLPAPTMPTFMADLSEWTSDLSTCSRCASADPRRAKHRGCHAMIDCDGTGDTAVERLDTASPSLAYCAFTQAPDPA